MFKKIIKTGVLLTGMVISGTAVAVVLNTAHDLRGTNTADGGQTCIYCHTPHGASSFAPLWNRQQQVTTYTMYSSPTIDMTIAGQPQDNSLGCLSCHDGTLALDALINFPAASSAGTIGAGPENLGADLSNDHPISVTYDPTQDPEFNAAVGGQVSGLQLFGAGANQVECGTCHSVHDNTNAPFLRISNAGSALCTACHIK